jgi:hypothetical protein
MYLIYQLYNLIKSFISLFLLKTKPEDILYSKTLLTILIGIDLIVNYEANVVGIKIFNLINKKHVNLIPLSLLQSTIILLIIILVLWSIIYGVLTFYKKQNRLVQILTSLVAVDIVLRLLLISGILILKYSIFAALILFIPLMYWEFVLYIFIFANGFNINYLKSGMFALIYMIIQHNLSEILAHFLIPKTY